MKIYKTKGYEMESAVSYLRLLPETAKEQKTFAESVVNAVVDGNVNPLETEVLFKAIENAIKMARQDWKYKECVSDEADKYAEKTFDFKQATFTRSQRKTFDFKGDAVWTDLKKSLTDRENFLKNIPEGSEVGDPETGEVIRRPPVKKTDIISIKF